MFDIADDIFAFARIGSADDAHRLVKSQVEPRGCGCLDDFAVDGHYISRKDSVAFAGGLPIDADAASFDEVIGFPPRTTAGATNIFIEADG